MVYLIGASGHAKVLIEILELQGLKIGGLIDANPEIIGLLDYPVTTIIPELFDIRKDFVIISIGNNRVRRIIAVAHNYRYTKAIHKAANISLRSDIGEGTALMAGVSINSGVRLGNHVIVNTNSSIDHDCIIEDYVHISPNAALAGNVFVGEGTHIGIGAAIIQGIRVGRWVTIGAGAVIVKDVPDYAVVVGNPGRIIKYNTHDEE